MSKNKTVTAPKSFTNTKTEELNLDILKQVGDNGAIQDFRKPVTFVPTATTKGRKQVFKSAQIEKDIDEYTDEVLNDMIPQAFRDRGFTVDETSVKFIQADKYIAREDAIVTLTQVQFSLKEPSLFDDAQEVIEYAAKAKSPKIVKVKEGTQERSLQVLLGDFQIGQADADGAEGTVKRILQIPALVKEEIRKNKVLKTPITEIVVAGLGDLVEGVAHFYNTQTFAVTLDRREQVKVARRLFQRILIELSELGIPMRVAVVPGNHGENRNVGGAFTGINDNDDVALVEQIQEAFALYPEKFGHIQFLFPEGHRLSLTIDVLGHAVGLVHGHQVGSPKALGASIRNYLNGQSRAKQAIGAVDYLYMGHFHHYYCERISEQTTVVMNGAMCKESDHFQQRFGLASPSCMVMGVLTRDGDEGFRPFYIQ